MQDFFFQTHVGQDQVTLLRDGAQCFPAMLEAIDQSEREILLEMYWFASDNIGRRVADKLIRKAKQGCKVFVLYDAIGSLETDSSMFDEMINAGCFVQQFSPIAPWRKKFRLSNVNHRDHRKFLVIDGEVGFVGGLNIGDPWMPKNQGGQGWRDDMVSIQGPSAQKLRRSFLSVWKTCSKDVIPAGALTNTQAETLNIPALSTGIEIIVNHRGPTRKAILKAYLRKIKDAQKQIYITNSYFIPDLRLRRALMRAVARGVDVRIMVPGINDVKAVQYASRHLYARFLKKGIRIYEWGHNVLHSKTATIDDWCTVGSFNFDWRSWRYNLEINIGFTDAPAAKAMCNQFLYDCQSSKPIKLKEWKKRSVFKKMIEAFFFLFRRFL